MGNKKLDGMLEKCSIMPKVIQSSRDITTSDTRFQEIQPANTTEHEAARSTSVNTKHKSRSLTGL